jgi:lipopolysaccharide/colanic/teichoic acid biosynthesis glycosyltransferase/glycosyltransferase involved in cell wall biosynthesis
MMASVVIPAYNAAGTIQECLEALRAQECEVPYEIIVVDDGSGDETAEMAAAPDVLLIRHESKRGAAAARNSGIRAARGEIVCFTDADCAPKADWINQLIRPLCEPDITGCKGTYETQQREIVARFVQIEYEDKYNLLAKQDHIDFIDTYSAAYRRPVLLANEGFDEQFVFLEDQELSFRLASRGYQMVFQPDATVYHYHSDSLGRYFRKKFLIGYWKAQIVRRFPGRAIQDSHTPQVMKFQILLVALMLAALAGILVTKWSVLFLAALLAVFMISAAPFLAKAWQRDRAVALAAPFLLMTRATALGFGYAWGLVMPARTVGEEHTIHGVSYVVKRGMDITGGFTGLVCTMLAGLVIAPAIKLDSEGPVIYKQERVGVEGRPFTLYKFRSMLNQPETELATMLEQAELDLLVVKPENDPRLTRIGRFLRRWSLDEMPQFWNVLKGDMSLVGPRPEETRFVEQYNDWQRRRLAVKPGMTGPMQVSGRADLPLDARVELELEYIENYSIGRDISLLLQTFPAVVFGEGAR